jgi:SHS2 domain-containing protein
MYETFEHTADLGIRVRAMDLDQLFSEAAQALFAVLTEDLAAIRPERELAIQVANNDRELLLFDWLRELLYQFDSQHLLLGRFETHVEGDSLAARCWGEPLDRERHHLLNEVKAITYHGLRVEQTEDGWLAEVIVDI